MTCKHCLSVLVDSKNSTCFTSHLKSCQPSLPLTNKVNGVQVIGDNIQIKWRSSDSSGSPPSTTPSKQMKDTPLKTMLLSKTPYQTNCVERKKLLDLLVELIVDMNMPISTVDHPSFVKYSSGLNCRFRVPCRQTMTNNIIPQAVS